MYKWAVTCDFQQCGIVRRAKPQISLRILAFWSEPLLVAWIFYECYATDWTSFGLSKLIRRLHRLVWVCTCQNATLLEITWHGSNMNFHWLSFVAASLGGYPQLMVGIKIFWVLSFFVCLIWFFISQSTIFQLCQDGSSWVGPVLSND